MNHISLNQIVTTESGWSCNVFKFGIINNGGVYIDEDEFENILVNKNFAYNLRTYARSKIVVVSSKEFVPYKYCALDFKYNYWKCLICKKLNKFFENKCFCNTYSNCWTPIECEIEGLIFSNDIEFKYHFGNDLDSQIIL